MSISGHTHALPRSRFAIVAFIGLTVAMSCFSPARASEERLPWVSTLESHKLDGTRGTPSAPYTAIPLGNDRYRVSSRFNDHDGQALALEFELDRAIALASMRDYGFSQPEVDAIQAQCRASGNCTAAMLDRLMHDYFRDHGLRVQQSPDRRMRLSVDIPQVVRRNRASVQPMVVALRELGRKQSFDADRRLAAAAALVQSGLAYRPPQDIENGRRTLGFYTPPRALEKGYGDCDTKSALLAAVLAGLGEKNVIGVRVPGHYLLGVGREARNGEASIQYNGRPYVLLEAAGPAARRPGYIAKTTRAALGSSKSIRIDPIF